MECDGACAAGKYSLGGFSASAGCTDATPGSYQNQIGQVFGIYCPNGKFNNAYGQIECKECPNGKYSGRNATKCEICRDGHFSFAGSADCTK
jgi:hypothetical protein